MPWMWSLLLGATALAMTPRDLRQAQRGCAQGDGAACHQLSLHLGTDEGARGHAARACSLGHAPGCVHHGRWVEARLGPSPRPIDAHEAVVAYERGCALGDATSCAAGSVTAERFQELLHLPLDRRLALHDGACRAGTASGCSHAAVLRALEAPASGAHPTNGPLVTQRRSAIVACYAGVRHRRIATYTSVVRIAAHGTVRRIQVDDAGPHGSCLSDAFASVPLPSKRSLTVWTLPVAVRIGPDGPSLGGSSSPVAPPRARIDAVLDGAPVDACMQAEAVRSQTPGGSVRVAFTVAPNGTVRDARITRSDLPAPAVQACVLDVVKALRFPSHPAAIEVDHTIRFRPW